MSEELLAALITLFRKETEDLIWASILQYYFNDGVPYTDTDQVKAIIPIESRSKYLTVNVMGVEYWFLPDLETLVEKIGSSSIGPHTISMDKIIEVAQWTILYRRSAGTGDLELNTLDQLKEDLGFPDLTELAAALLQKVDKEDGKHLVSDILIQKIHDKFAEDEAAVIQGILDFLENLVLTDNNFTDAYKNKLDLLHQDVYTINLPTGDVSERAAGATFGDGITPYSVENPTGWRLEAAANPNDLEITHNLGRKFAHVSVSYLDGTEQVLLMGSLGYAGISAPSDDVLIIKGLSTKAFPLVINLIFA